MTIGKLKFGDIARFSDTARFGDIASARLKKSARVVDGLKLRGGPIITKCYKAIDVIDPELLKFLAGPLSIRNNKVPYTFIRDLAKKIPELDLSRAVTLPTNPLKWEDYTDHNLIVTAGRNHAGDTVFTGSAQITAWFVILLSASPTVAAADTMSSHAGWTEFVAYDEAARVAWVEARTSNGVWSNSASEAIFTISTNGSSIGGCGLTSVNTKSGTTGTLYSATAFTGGNRAADDNDQLLVTYSQTAADDGV